MATTKKKDGTTKHSKAMSLADQAFSRYIRSRASDESHGLESKTMQCITCERTIEIMKGDCGHCNPRGDMRTRYDDVNCSGQCAYCNQYGNGQTIKFLAAIREKHGQEEHDRIVKIGETKSITKLHVYELLEIARDYDTKAMRFWSMAGLPYPWKKLSIPEK
jgi:hypothetical protein